MQHKTTGNTDKKKKLPPKSRVRRLALGRRSLLMLASGEKTSMLVSARKYPWVEHLRKGQHVHVYRVQHLGVASVAGTLSIMSVCTHSRLDEVESCGKHNPEQIDSNHPNWEWVLGNARTNGQQSPVRISNRKQQQNASSPWAVIDFIYEAVPVPTPPPTDA